MVRTSASGSAPYKLLVGAVALLLVSFVSPFSYLPNPLGLYYLARGGYSYDARYPLFVNRFVLLRADVEVALESKLDRLLGLTGLDPLDPSSPLSGYEIERVTYGSGAWSDWGQARVRMRYADGTNRLYVVPVAQSSQSFGRPGGWAYTGLDRLFAPHEELSGLPLAPPDPPVRLGSPQRLSTSEDAHRLGSARPIYWYTSGSRLDDSPLWAPDGRALLVKHQPDTYPGGLAHELWLVPTDASQVVRLAPSVRGVAWSSEPRRVVYVRPRQSFPVGEPEGEVVVVGLDGQDERVLGQADLHSRPVVVGDSVWWQVEGALWRSSLREIGSAVDSLDLPDLARAGSTGPSFAISPDGDRLAYRCGHALCLADSDGARAIRLDLGAPPRLPAPMPRALGELGPKPTALPYQPPVPAAAIARSSFASLTLAWSHGGDRLAVVASDHAPEAWPVLFVLGRDGRKLVESAVGPNGLAGVPEWTPDGRFVFLSAFPEGGRRIVVVDAGSGRVLDLSQPRFDALSTLAPDGQRLLLWNGRGGLWVAPLVY